MNETLMETLKEKSEAIGRKIFEDLGDIPLIKKTLIDNVWITSLSGLSVNPEIRIYSLIKEDGKFDYLLACALSDQVISLAFLAGNNKAFTLCNYLNNYADLPFDPITARFINEIGSATLDFFQTLAEDDEALACVDEARIKLKEYLSL